MNARLGLLALALCTGCGLPPLTPDEPFAADVVVAPVASDGLVDRPRVYADDATLVASLEAEARAPWPPAMHLVAPGPAGDLVLCGQGTAVELWRLDPATGVAARLDVVELGPGQWPLSAAWFADGAQAVTCAASGDLRMWRVEGCQLVGRPLALERDREGHTISGVGVLPDGSLVLVDRFHDAVARWTLDVESGRLRKAEGLGPFPAKLGGAVVTASPDGRQVFVGQEGQGWLYEHGRPPRALQVAGDVHAAAFAGDGLVLARAVGEEAALERWSTGDEPARLGPPTVLDSPRVLGLSPDGRRLVGGALELWRVAPALERVGAPPLPRAAVEGALAVAADGRVVRLGQWPEGMAELHSSAGEDAGQIASLGMDVQVAAFSPDGRWLVAGGGGLVRTWSIAGRLTRTAGSGSGDDALEPTDALEVGGGAVRSLQLAADGRFVLLGAELLLGRVDAEGGLSVVARLEGCADVSLSADGRWLLTTDGKAGPPGARLWRLDGELRTPVARLGSTRATHVALSPDGAEAATVHEDGAWRWRLDGPRPAPSTLLDAAGPLAYDAKGALRSERRPDGRGRWRPRQLGRVEVAGQPLSWGRSASAGSPRLDVRVVREGEQLVVEVLNQGAGPAFELVGWLSHESAATPLGELLPIAFGAVPAGAKVTRRVVAPAQGALLRGIEWSGGLPPTTLDPGPGPEVAPRRRALRDAGRLLLALRRARTDELELRWLTERLPIALARDGDRAALLQLDPRADLTALAKEELPDLVPDPEEAIPAETLDAALKEAQGEVRDARRIAVGRALARAGRVADALALQSTFRRRAFAAQALLEVALAQAEAGDLAGARTTALGTTKFVGTADGGLILKGKELAYDPFDPERWLLDLDWEMLDIIRMGERWERAPMCRLAARLDARLGAVPPSAYARAFDAREAPLELLAVVAAGQPERARAWLDGFQDRRAKAVGLLAVGAALLPPR